MWVSKVNSEGPSGSDVGLGIPCPAAGGSYDCSLLLAARLPGEEPRHPARGHHPAGSLFPEQVRKADFPGGRCHGKIEARPESLPNPESCLSMDPLEPQSRDKGQKLCSTREGLQDAFVWFSFTGPGCDWGMRLREGIWGRSLGTLL